MEPSLVPATCGCSDFLAPLARWLLELARPCMSPSDQAPLLHDGACSAPSFPLFVCLFVSVGKKKNYPFRWGRGQRPEQGRRQAPWRGQAGCRTGTVAAAAGSRPWGQRSPLLPLATLFSRLRPSGWPLPGDCASFPQPPTPVSLLGASPTADTWARPHTASQLPTPGKTPGVPPGPGMAHAWEEGGRRERCGHGHPGGWGPGAGATV